MMIKCLKSDFLTLIWQKVNLPHEVQFWAGSSDWNGSSPLTMNPNLRKKTTTYYSPSDDIWVCSIMEYCPIWEWEETYTLFTRTFIPSMSDTEKNTAPPPAADKKPGSALEADLTKYKVSFQFPVLTLFSPPLIPNNARSTTITDGWLIFIFF